MPLKTTPTAPTTKNGHRAVQPPAGQRLRSRERQSRGLIAGAVVAVLACAFGVALLFMHAGGKVSVIQAARAVPAGHVIASADLTTVEIAGDVPALRGSQLSTVVGKVAAVGLVKGEVVSAAMVTTRAPAPPGYVVAGMALKYGQLPAGGLSAGDNVMVVLLASSTAGGAAGSPTVLESSVRVVAASSAPDGSGVVVSVLIPKADAAALAQANNDGLLALQQVPSS
jgi:hypothetical protein